MIKEVNSCKLAEIIRSADMNKVIDFAEYLDIENEIENQDFYMDCSFWHGIKKTTFFDEDYVVVIGYYGGGNTKSKEFFYDDLIDDLEQFIHEYFNGIGVKSVYMDIDESEVL